MSLIVPGKYPYTLRRAQHADRVVAVLQAALDAAEPGAAVAQYVQRQGQRVMVGEQLYDLEQFERVFVVGAGKAGAPMAGAMHQILGDRIVAGVVVVKEGYTGAPQAASRSNVKIAEAGHPVPDARGVRATRQVIELLDQAGGRDLVFCLISGGGSATLTAPVAGTALDDLQALTALLLASGASIVEINTLRKHLDQVKGGQLARLTQPARLVTLVLSDVVGSPLEVIASGPTVPDPTTFQDAWDILARYDLLLRAPAPIVQHLERGRAGQIPDTPKPGDALFAGVQTVIIGSNLQAAQAACQRARDLGLHALLLTTYLEGEARQAGQFLAAIARQTAETGQPAHHPACIIAGGETTVTLRGDGAGGRNQEVALGALAGLAGLQDVLLVTLATDGGDGPTDAAGAFVDGQSLQRALQSGMLPEDYLARNDAYHFFANLEDLLITGPTQTNVNDLTFIFVG